MSKNKRTSWTDDLARELRGQNDDVNRKSRTRRQASAQKIASQDHLAWAHRAEDRVNGLRQQVVQNLGKQHPLYAILTRASDELSDYIFNAGNSTDSTDSEDDNNTPVSESSE